MSEEKPEDFDVLMHQMMMASFYAKITENIAKDGFHMNGVFGTVDDPGPSFTYTVGLSPKFGYELIMFGPNQVAAVIFHEIVDALKTGSLLNTDVDDDRWIMGRDGTKLPARFMRCNDEVYKYATMTAAYYQNQQVPYLQLVVPDKNSKFPGEEGYDEAYMSPRQPLLYDH